MRSSPWLDAGGPAYSPWLDAGRPVNIFGIPALV